MQRVSKRKFYDGVEWGRIRNCGARLKGELDGLYASQIARRITDETGIPVSIAAVHETCNSAGYTPKKRVIHKRIKDVDKQDGVKVEQA